jgi:hypothetical protein
LPAGLDRRLRVALSAAWQHDEDMRLVPMSSLPGGG